jgi:hypothetical protein
MGGSPKCFPGGRDNFLKNIRLLEKIHFKSLVKNAACPNIFKQLSKNSI